MDALQKAGCDKIYNDKMTGSRFDRPGWVNLLEYARPGDTLVVTELSRMTRSFKTLEERQINLVSLRESIDTSTATGRCFLSMMGAIHQMERELKAEHAAAGRASAKARGRSGGRPRTDLTKLQNARVLYENSDKTANEICKTIGISRRALFAYQAEQKKKAT